MFTRWKLWLIPRRLELQRTLQHVKAIKQGLEFFHDSLAQTGAVFGYSVEQRYVRQHRGLILADVETTKPPRLIAKTVRICVEAVSLPVLLSSLVGWPRPNSFMITDSSVSGSSPQVRGPLGLHADIAHH